MTKSEGKHSKKNGSTRDKILISIFIVIICLSIISVIAVYFMNSRPFLNKDNSNDEQNGGKIASEIVTPTEIKDKAVNFLVCGIDYEEDSGRGRLTDVIMFVSFDIEAKNVDILQIPRDSYIGDDYPTGKINAIYGQSTNGGIDGLAKRINQTLNLTIDHYVTLDMDGFVKIIDEIGGVEVDVPNYIDLEGVQLYPGLQTLDGNKAQIFVRERYSYANGDLGRIEMQQVFLKALINKVFTMGMGSAASVAPTLISNITTDLSLNEILGYFTTLMSVDKDSGINFHTLPVSGGIYRGLSVLAINAAETAELLNQHFRPYTDDVPASELGILSINFDPPKTASSTTPSYDEPIASDDTPSVDESYPDEFIDESGGITDENDTEGIINPDEEIKIDDENNYYDGFSDEGF